MTKILTFIATLCLAINVSVAQVAINTDGSPADSSAMLDIKSTTKGLLVPRLTSVQRLAINKAADGLFVYDSVAKQLYYYQRGYGWQQLVNSNGTFSLPFTGTVSSPSTAFTAVNSGAGDALDGLSTSGNGLYAKTNFLGASGVLADNVAGGEAIVGRTLSGSGAPTAAITGRNDGPGYGTYGFAATDTSGTGIGVLGQSGVNGGKGIAGHFENLNASNAANTLEAVTNGLGIVASFISRNSADTANALSVISYSEGNINNPRVGNGGNFFVNDTTSIAAGVRGEVNSIYGNYGAAGVYGSSSGTGGYGGYFDQTNANGYGMALEADQFGFGTGSHFENYLTTNTSNVLEAEADGLGNAGSFSIYNPANTSNALYAITTGLGSVANFIVDNASDTANALSVTTNTIGNLSDPSVGNAGNFFHNNTDGLGAGVRGEVNSMWAYPGVAGVYGSSSGAGGYGGYFDITNANSNGSALYATTAGVGAAVGIQNTNASNNATIINATSNGGGTLASFTNTSTTTTANTLSVSTNSPGNINDMTQGNAGYFFHNGEFSLGAGVLGVTNTAVDNPGAAGVYGVTTGTGGYGGFFQTANTNSLAPALAAENDGQGIAFFCEQFGTAGDIAVFSTDAITKARIDRNGKGFFDGGTQNSGADLAEAFDVEGKFSDYEPGDVLEISASSDRAVVKSSSPYSTLVVGVYATKPGVLLTEDSLSDTSSTTGKVPMGVIGVIPTKVCNENGPIARGDLLVTSSRPGYAMKADINKVKPGQILGKALQAFDGITGKIKVMVSIK